jgi:hypothetical protein
MQEDDEDEQNEEEWNMPNQIKKQLQSSKLKKKSVSFQMDNDNDEHNDYENGIDIDFMDASST